EVRRGLDKADLSKRREIIRCMVKVIKIEGDHVRITYRVSPRPFAKAPTGGPFRQHCHRRVLRNITRAEDQEERGPLPQDRTRQVRAPRQGVRRQPHAVKPRPCASGASSFSCPVWGPDWTHVKQRAGG